MSNVSTTDRANDIASVLGISKNEVVTATNIRKDLPHITTIKQARELVETLRYRRDEPDYLDAIAWLEKLLIEELPNTTTAKQASKLLDKAPVDGSAAQIIAVELDKRGSRELEDLNSVETPSDHYKFSKLYGWLHTGSKSRKDLLTKWIGLCTTLKQVWYGYNLGHKPFEEKLEEFCLIALATKNTLEEIDEFLDSHTLIINGQAHQETVKKYLGLCVEPKDFKNISSKVALENNLPKDHFWVTSGWRALKIDITQKWINCCEKLVTNPDITLDEMTTMWRLFPPDLWEMGLPSCHDLNKIWYQEWDRLCLDQLQWFDICYSPDETDLTVTTEMMLAIKDLHDKTPPEGKGESYYLVLKTRVALCHKRLNQIDSIKQCKKLRKMAPMPNYYTTKQLADAIDSKQDKLVTELYYSKKIPFKNLAEVKSAYKKTSINGELRPRILADWNSMGLAAVAKVENITQANELMPKLPVNSEARTALIQKTAELLPE